MGAGRTRASGLASRPTRWTAATTYDAIHDYTSDKVEIEIKLPRGQYAQDLIDALYVYTECQVILHSILVVIKDNLPWEPNIHQILELNVNYLQDCLTRELEMEKRDLLRRYLKKLWNKFLLKTAFIKKLKPSPTTIKSIIPSKQVWSHSMTSFPVSLPMRTANGC